MLSRGETLDDMVESRRWIHEHGVDLMCESREPADGLIAYDMSIKANLVDIEHPPDFVTLRRMFEKAEAQPFDFLTPGDSLPKTYLFRTGDGALGVLEVVRGMGESQAGCASALSASRRAAEAGAGSSPATRVIGRSSFVCRCSAASGEPLARKPTETIIRSCKTPSERSRSTRTSLMSSQPSRMGSLRP